MLLKICLIYIGVMSLITFILFGIDKKRAVTNQWRIKEATLIGMSFLGGAIGGILGMNCFRHKTRKLKFVVVIPLALMFNIIIVCLVIYLTSKI